MRNGSYTQLRQFRNNRFGCIGINNLCLTFLALTFLFPLQARAQVALSVQTVAQLACAEHADAFPGAYTACPFQPARYRNLDPRVATLEINPDVEQSGLLDPSIPPVILRPDNGETIVLDDEKPTERLLPGSLIVLAARPSHAPYQNVKIYLRQRRATFQRPIFLVGADDSVELTGSSQIEAIGSNIVIYRLKFRNGALDTRDKSQRAVIKLGRLAVTNDRTFPPGECHQCIAMRVTVENYAHAGTGEEASLENNYLTIYGRDSTLALSRFSRFAGLGFMVHVPQRSQGDYQQLVDECNPPANPTVSVPQRAHIYKNIFEDKEFAGNNPALERGGEVIQIGSGARGIRDCSAPVTEPNAKRYPNYAAPSYSVIEGNVIRRAAAFPGVITLKASDVIIRDNNISHVDYPILLRASNRDILYNNQLFGSESQSGPNEVGAVYVSGKDIVLLQNRIANNSTPPKNTSHPLTIMAGQVQSLAGDGSYLSKSERGLPRSVRVLAKNNVFSNNRSTIHFATNIDIFRSGIQIYPLPPYQARVFENTFSTPHADPAVVLPLNFTLSQRERLDFLNNIWGAGVVKGF